MASLDTKRLSLAFQSRPDLVQQIQAATAKSPAHTQLFNDISSYVCEQLNSENNGEPAQKRRRVDNSGEAAHSNSNGAALPARQASSTSKQQTNGSSANSALDDLASAAAEPVLLEVKDISVSIPQRKKYDLCFTQNYLYARASNTTAPVPGIVYAWRDIEHVFYLPVPEKAQVQYNYILFPRGAALAALSKPASATDVGPAATTPVAEPLVFTVSAAAPKPSSVGGPSAGLAASVSDSYTTLFHWAIEGQLRAVQNVYLADKNNVIVAADPKVFHSAARQPFRPNEKAVHVRAFRGSKDGYLFFLPTGILWGFKKPLLFLPLDRIVAVSYTNVLQRTFNIVVEVDVGGGATGGENDDGNEEIEFGMLDQEDYNGISEMYVQRHRLQDRSMAERRKAKRELVENARGEKAGAGANGANGDGADGVQEDDGLTELQRAEQQLQDEEDEDEEDYDPGSDGDSDGSGSSSEEEDEDGDGEGGNDDEDDEDDEDVEVGEGEEAEGDE
ncbi:hypothetical protein SBRCBS47491_004085 [Sporothrix bragantina]|uniref:Histone chaperone RTT106/FACT complex subunit SPT16-like middle domain-containing protein n=1 Tax=Sporothrix bragantina TaxID=671064 RepID=A0ABP0BLV2_9PEZI